jgi:TRAP-type C4-dicarboxylate transport system permease small subunit
MVDIPLHLEVIGKGGNLKLRGEKTLEVREEQFLRSEVGGVIKERKKMSVLWRGRAFMKQGPNSDTVHGDKPRKGRDSNGEKTLCGESLVNSQGLGMLSRIGRITKKIIRRLSISANVVGMFILLGMMFLTVGDVLGRNFLNMPIAGTFELSKFMLAIFVLLGIAYTQQVEGNIKITILFSLLPFGVRLYLNSITTFLSLVFFIIIAWQGWEVTLHQYKVGLTSDLLKVPVWPFMGLVFVGAVLVCLELAIQLETCVRNMVKGKARRGATDEPC